MTSVLLFLGGMVLGVTGCELPVDDLADQGPDLADLASDGGPDQASDQASDQALDQASDQQLDQDQGQARWPVQDCDPLVPQQCAMPWPSNLYLAPDATRQTGYTLTFGSASLPRNRLRRFIDPAPLKRLDGYGLGVALHAVFPDVDLSGMADEEHIERSLDEDSAVIWLAVAADGQVKRVPFWVELDAREQDPAQRVLYVRPAVILEPATRYIVAFRGLKDTRGQLIPASPAFASLRDGAPSQDLAVSSRVERFASIFAILEGQGVERASLTLAWDFVTASQQALQGDLVWMRDDALAKVGPRGPALRIDVVKRFYRPDQAQPDQDTHEDIALQIEGTFEAPLYLRPRGARGAQLNQDAQGQLTQAGTRQVPFIARIPHVALEGAALRLITYGHGLFGSRYEILAGHIGKLAQRYGFAVLAVDLYGMAAQDSLLGQDAAIDASEFVSIGDKLHQGLIESLLLARAARGRLQDALDEAALQVSVDPASLYYFGASQGGIFGQTYMALSQDVTRGYLAVPGNNYSLMLDRSVNFEQFEAVLSRTYPDTLSRRLIVSILQLHWDRTDGLSYLRQIKRAPLPQTPPHDVILAVSKGDYQVAVVTNEIAARSALELPILGVYDRERSPWGVPTAPYPHQGSGLILWDFGNPWPTRRANLPPQDGLSDPHSRQAEVDAIGDQMDRFFRDGVIIDLCGGQPCAWP